MAQFAKLASLSGTQSAPGMTRAVLAGEKLMLVRVELTAGAVVPAHSHAHEQMGYVIAGRVRFHAGGQQAELGPGDMYALAGGEEHGVDVLGNEAAVVLDVFTPIREDFLPRG